MLQKNKPDDYVIATGKQYTVREFITKCFKYVDIDITWTGTGDKELGKDKYGKTLVKVDKFYYRPNEVRDLLGDSRKAQKELNCKNYDGSWFKFKKWIKKYQSPNHT